MGYIFKFLKLSNLNTESRPCIIFLMSVKFAAILLSRKMVKYDLYHTIQTYKRLQTDIADSDNGTETNLLLYVLLVFHDFAFNYKGDRLGNVVGVAGNALNEVHNNQNI